MTQITYADAERALAAVEELLAYQHPTTRCGLRQDVSLALIRLRRALTAVMEDYNAARLALFKRYGEEDKNGQWIVRQDSDEYDEFSRESIDLMVAAVEVTQSVKLSDLVCRDGTGAYVPIEPRGKALDDLGPLLEMPA